MMNVGIRVTCVGSIIVASSSRKILSRKGHLKRENAKAARLHESSVPIVETTTTKSEFNIQRPKGRSLMTRS